MKMLVGFLLFALSLSTLASSGETKTFVYDGTQRSIELILRGDKTHTEYRYEDRQSICYRTEIVGWRTICSGPGPGYPGPGPRPMPGPGRCWQEPIYRQVAYSCIQRIQIPFEVKDYDVDARVIVDVTNLSEAATAGETFKVTLHGDDLSITALGSKKFFLVLKKQDVRSAIRGSVKYMDAVYAIELVEAAPVLNALKMSNISLSNSLLSFGLGPVTNRANLGFALTVVHKKTLGSDTTLFDRELVASEVAINSTAAGSVAGVEVEKLGVNLVSGKYALTAKIFLKAGGTLMNKSQFGELEASRTLLYKIR
jgi:hypothetical protein